MLLLLLLQLRLLLVPELKQQNGRTIVKTRKSNQINTMKRSQPKRKPSIVLKISLASRITGFHLDSSLLFFALFFVPFSMRERIIPLPVIHIDLNLRVLVKFEWNNENEILLVTNRIKL